MDKTFFNTLRTLRKGKTVLELDDAMAELADKVKRTGRTGELILKLKVKPMGKGEIDQVNIEDDVVVKAPRFERGVTMFFVTEENAFVRTDPRQSELAGLREVDGETKSRKAS